MLAKHTIIAGLAISFASLLGPNFARAAGTSLTLQFSGVSHSIVDPYVMLFSSPTGTETFEGFATLQTIPTGSSSQTLVLSPTASSQSNPTDIQTNTPINGFVMMGVYPPSLGDQGVTVGVNTTFAPSIEGDTFAQLAAAISPLIPSESDVVAALESPTPADISAILGEVGTPIAADDAVAIINPNGNGDLLDFTDAALNGSVTSTLVTTSGPSTVPLPSAAWMALITLAALATISALRTRSRLV
jgi:hypothetical protein